jgi:2-methylaconitate cis-trans-isomerase PrpF
MSQVPQIRIPATYLRGGTSKGVLQPDDLPETARVPGRARDKLLLRVIGSPDPGKQIDGMGGATSSTSKTVIISRSSRPGHDVDYLFGQVSIDKDFVDWSGNCGNLSAAVGRSPSRPGRSVRCRGWRGRHHHLASQHRQDHHRARAHPGGQVQETGDFELDGVTFPAAEVQLEFMDPAEEEGAGGAMFPTGNAGRHAGRARQLQGHHDQCRHPDHLPQRRRLGYPAPSCRTPSTATRPRWRASRPSAPMAPCAWA